MKVGYIYKNMHATGVDPSIVLVLSVTMLKKDHLGREIFPPLECANCVNVTDVQDKRWIKRPYWKSWEEV